MDVLVVGGSGLLGVDLVHELRSRGHTVDAPPSDELDITDDRSVGAYFLAGNPDWIINCAAYTAVDQAESEQHAARLLNAYGPTLLAKVTTYMRCRMLHISTDFVFDGTKRQPYSEDDPPNPLCTYGRTKLEGEQNVLATNADCIVVRTAWLFGASRRCFPRSILERAMKGESLRVVNDQVGAPTYTRDLSTALANLIEHNAPGGIYHVVNSGEATWYDVATAVIEQAGLSATVEPIPTEAWQSPARRPLYSVLATDRYRSLGFAGLPDWRDALSRFVSEINMISN